MTRRRFQFRLRTLVIALPILAALLALLRREMVGRVELPWGVHATSGNSPMVTLIFGSESDAHSAAERFDQSARTAIHLAAVSQLSRDRDFDLLVPFDHTMTLVAPPTGTMIAVKYNVPHWERTYFSLRQLAYASTANDPVAQRRNEALERALVRAIVDWAHEGDAPIKIRVDALHGNH